MLIKQSCKGGPKHEDSRLKPISKESQNAEFEKRRTGRDRAHQGLPMENTTDHGGGDARSCPSHARPCAPGASDFFSLFRVAFRLN